MRTRAPTYFKWADGRPVTNNQIYGSWADVPSIAEEKPHHNTEDTHDPTRTDKMPRRGCKYPSRPSACCCPCDTYNLINMNQGFTAGKVPLAYRMCRRMVPVGKRVIVQPPNPPPAWVEPMSRAHHVYLWHTLTGPLAHYLNYPSCPKDHTYTTPAAFCGLWHRY